MLSHVSVGTKAFEPAFAFYEALFSELGHKLRFCDREKPWAAWQQQAGGRPLFLLSAPFDGEAASAGNGQMIALLAGDRASVDRCYSTALARGGSCEGPPGLRPHYHPNYYGAYFRDPDGNKLCVCCHEAE
ncbi:Catechol 2,3-dioxygenase [Bosea lupini]|uniref:Catechol 2,3-dioxygenase n=1 Tax=Bosea lupini TaxID=1036779 RepID=A0A1H7X009_9HYPH|nr:VOC family protein [Bosea lupini]SEM27202.1 Catechol 2,3-dioxygenase [Bosea lupini]